MHVTHRGVNRAAVFLDTEDFDRYRTLLGKALSREGVALHAYVLMTNHVHLLVSAEREHAFSRAMCLLGKGYVPAFNRRHGRTGTLWEGRFRSCLVDSDQYLLSAYRYIELNPVRAGMVARAEDYAWSSAQANLGRADDALVTPHAQFAAVGSDAVARIAWYRAWLDQAIPPAELGALRMHAAQERAFGSKRFQAMVAATLNRDVSVRARGRPRRPLDDVAPADGLKR
jgi:putative transposase